MTRILSIWLLHWPIDRLRRATRRSRAKYGLRSSPSANEAEGAQVEKTPAEKAGVSPQPFALTLAGARGIRLYAVNKAATREGIRPDMALADARAILPSLRVREADPALDAGALTALARWMWRYSPWVTVAGGNGLTLDISGCAHLFGGETELLDDLGTRLKAAGVSARFGIAGTIGAAHAIARYRARFFDVTTSIVGEGEERESLAPLGVEALRLDSETVLLLRRLGLKRMGDLYSVPRLSLARRFSRAGAKKNREGADAVLLRLDQALGRVSEPVNPMGEPPRYRARMAFAEPIGMLEDLVHALKTLAGDLAHSLEKAGEGARQLDFMAFRVDGTVAGLKAGIGRPSRDPAHFLRLFTEKLEEIDPGFGVDTCILAASLTESLAPGQVSMTATDPVRDATRLAALIDRLSNRLGGGQVTRRVPAGSHIPERAEQVLLAQQGAIEGAQAPPWTGEAWQALRDPLPRPFRLLRYPEAMEVMAEVPEGPPLMFHWRRQSCRVVRAEGPERLAPEWWRMEAEKSEDIRDYYRIEDDKGHRFWVYREGLYQDPAQDQARRERPRWFMHGFFA